jgi:hypothetical protein
MKTTNKGLNANVPQSLPNVDQYLYGLDSKWPEIASVYQSELNLLIHNYKEVIKLFRQNKEKTALAIAQERLAYWTGVQRDSGPKDCFQGLIIGRVQQGKGGRKKRT